MSELKDCKVCGEKEGPIYHDMCDFCRQSILRKSPRVARNIEQLERRIREEPDCREELEELLDVRYSELMRLERMS